jgi:putative ABC transport system ATP-binding protein
MTALKPGDSVGNTVLQARNLTKTYSDGETRVSAVVDVDLEASRGEMLLIMGPSGSGKTTLLSLIGGLTRPTSGTVYVAGHTLSSLPERERVRIRRDLIGFVFQDFKLLGALTARENVEIALNLSGTTGKAARERAAGLLTELGLQDRLDFMPSQLSGGEQQRVAIARALAHEPLLILADEPTANLDSKHGLEIVELLSTFARNQARCVIIVSHDFRIQDLATRVARLEDGRLMPAEGNSYPDINRGAEHRRHDTLLD